MIEVILLQDVDKLGKIRQVVKVKDGFARNFLLPNKLAMPLTAQNLKKIEHQKELKLKAEQERKSKAEELAQKLSGKSFTITAQAHEGDKLYGSVTTHEISRILEEEGFAVEKNNILLSEPIKSTGIFDIEIKLHPEVKTKIKVWVVAK